jgi:DNA-binding XRE family transcriptional regulator
LIINRVYGRDLLMQLLVCYALTLILDDGIKLIYGADLQDNNKNIRFVMITTQKLRAARALLGCSQDQLAERSGVSKPTIARLELGDGASEIGGYPATRDKLRACLEAAGIEFLNGRRPGVRLKA